MRGVLGQPARDRVVVRADPRAQQHQHRPADGRPRDAAPPRGRRVDPARRVHARPRRDHRADHRERRPAAVLRAARARARSRVPPTGTGAAADEPDREDPRGEAPPRPGRRTSSPATRCSSRSTPATRTSSRPRRSTSSSRAEYGAGYKLPEPVEVRRVRGSPDLRDRRRLDGEVRRQDRAAARRSSARSPRAPASATTTRSTASRPGICHQVAREQFIDPGDFVQATDSHTCMGGASGALAWGVGSTEYAALLYWGFTPIAVPESIRFELTGAAAPGRHREGRDAPHPRDLREARGDAQPRDGVRRRRAVRAVARRARDAREHGDRVLGARRGDGGRRRRCCAGSPSAGPGATIDDAAREGRDAGSGRPPRRRRPPRSISRRSRRWSRRPAIPIAASRAIRRTAR